MSRVRHQVKPSNVGAVPYCVGHNQRCSTPCRTSSVNITRGFTMPFESIKRCVDEIHPGPPYKTGGPFDVFKIELPATTQSLKGQGVYEGYPCGGVNICKSLPRYVYNAKWAPAPAIISDCGLTFPISDPFKFGEDGRIPSALDVDLEGRGAEAWNKFKPGKPKYSFGQSLAEIREVPKMLRDTARIFKEDWKIFLRKKRRERAIYGSKWIAKQWLATNFGWAPFIRDLISLHQAIENFEKEKNDFLKYSNKWIYRRGVLSQKLEEEPTWKIGTSTRHSWNGSTASTFFTGAGSTKISRTTYQKIWFVGKFKYFLPWIPGNKVWTDISYLKHQFGLSLNPSLVWQLTKFSWLIDWFANIGDILENAESADYVVAKYAYLMAHTKVTYTVKSTALLTGCQSASSTYAEWPIVLERKSRIVANPFGFDLDWPDLSSWQLSILGALGLGYMPIKANRG